MPATDDLPVIPPAFIGSIRSSHIGHIPPQRGWSMQTHIHPDFHEFILVLQGEIETRICGKELHGRRGDLLLYPAGEAHSEQTVGDEPLETLFVAWHATVQESKHGYSYGKWFIYDPKLPLLVHDSNARARMLMQWLQELSPLRKTENVQKAAIIMTALVYQYQELTRMPQENLVGLIRTYIQRHLTEQISLDHLASVAGFSRCHFSREFKRLSGITPMAFVRQERVEAARSLLLSTPWTLNRIAELVGFTDETHLSRVFHRLMGIPPGQIRK